MPVNARHVLRRKRSHLNRWIQDQQYQVEHDDVFDDVPESPVERIGTPCNPYLAYPHLSVASFQPKTLNEVGSMYNYVVVDDVVDDETRPDDDHFSVDSDGAEVRLCFRIVCTHLGFYSNTQQHMFPPPSPVIEKSPQSFSVPKKRLGPSSLRNFHLSFRSPIPAISITGVESSASRSPSRLSLFRSPRRSSSTIRNANSKHNRSSSLSTLNLPPQGISSEGSIRGAASESPSWRWRQSVRSRFSSSSPVPKLPALSYETHRSRPSMSSTNTSTSVLTPPASYDDEDTDILSTPSKTVLLNSVLSREKSPTRPLLFRNEPGTASVPSLWSGPTSVSHTPENSGSTSQLVHKESAIRIPFSPKGKHVPLTPTSTKDDESQALYGPQVVYPSAGKGSVPRASLSSLSSPREKRKKKLVVSGIGLDDTARLQAMKNWCESFGEVTQIMRMPNGDLHIHFRKAEVAETVCRL